jgi:heme/copper-type cytochrome/quinol oxidase subunit 3
MELPVPFLLFLAACGLVGLYAACLIISKFPKEWEQESVASGLGYIVIATFVLSISVLLFWMAMVEPFEYGSPNRAWPGLMFILPVVFLVTAVISWIRYRHESVELSSR